MRGQNIQPIKARDFLGRERAFHPVPVWTDEPQRGPDGVPYALLRVGAGAAELSVDQMRQLVFQLNVNIDMAEAMLPVEAAEQAAAPEGWKVKNPHWPQGEEPHLVRKDEEDEAAEKAVEG